MARLAALRPDLVALGARVALVTLGRPDTVAACAERAPGIDCLVVPDAALYRRFGLERAGLAEVASPAAFVAGVRATLAGHRNGLPTGDGRQMPGTFVIDAAGRIAYARYAAHVGDHTPDAEIVAAVARAAGGNGEVA